jgi:hypothetical protein
MSKEHIKKHLLPESLVRGLKKLSIIKIAVDSGFTRNGIDELIKNIIDSYIKNTEVSEKDLFDNKFSFKKYPNGGFYPIIVGHGSNAEASNISKSIINNLIRFYGTDKQINEYNDVIEWQEGKEEEEIGVYKYKLMLLNGPKIVSSAKSNGPKIVSSAKSIWQLAYKVESFNHNIAHIKQPFPDYPLIEDSKLITIGYYLIEKGDKPEIID